MFGPGKNLRHFQKNLQKMNISLYLILNSVVRLWKRAKGQWCCSETSPSACDWHQLRDWESNSRVSHSLRPDVLVDRDVVVNRKKLTNTARKGHYSERTEAALSYLQYTHYEERENHNVWKIRIKWAEVDSLTQHTKLNSSTPMGQKEKSEGSPNDYLGGKKFFLKCMLVLLYLS